MATNCTFEFYNEGPDGRGGKISGVVSLADVVVNTTPNTTGGWNTATVTADKQQAIYLGPTDAATAGCPQGWYQSAGGAIFQRKQGRC